MPVMLMQREWQREQMITIVPDTSFETFVGKLQKAKTRKGLEYFVMRVTVPKEVTRKIGAEPGDYLFFKAKKAKWYHMLDWRKMEKTWMMLPTEIRNRAILENLPHPGTQAQIEMQREDIEALGSANPASFSPLIHQTCSSEIE